MTFTQSDVDHYDEMLTKHDPHSPYFNGPFTDSPSEEEEDEDAGA